MRRLNVGPWFMVVILALLGVLLTACASGAEPAKAPASQPAAKAAEPAKPAAATSSEPAKIAVVGALTGNAAAYGVDILAGVKLAVDEANKAGGVLGQQIQIVDFDDKCDPKEAASIANRIASDKSILVVVGNVCSAATLAAIPILKEAKIPKVGAAGTAPALRGSSPYYRRVQVTDEFQGMELAKWAREAGYQNAALVYQNTDYGKGVASVVEKGFTAAGGKVVVQETHKPLETTDYGTVITKVKDAKPDVIVSGQVDSEAALFQKQAHRAGLKVPFMATNALYTDNIIKLAGEDAEGIMVTGFFFPDSPDAKVQAFVKNYKAANSDKGPSMYSANGYDSAHVIVDAIKRAGKVDREALNNALLNAPEYAGVTGSTKFDSAGDATKPLGASRLVVKDGKWALWKK